YTLHYFPINITNPIDIYILSLHDALPILNVQSIDDAVENETTLNLKDPDTIKRLEKQLEERVDKRIRTALEHVQQDMQADILGLDRKSTRLNSSHVSISYAVFCLKKKKTK